MLYALKKRTYAVQIAKPPVPLMLSLDVFDLFVDVVEGADIEGLELSGRQAFPKCVQGLLETGFIGHHCA